MIDCIGGKVAAALCVVVQSRGFVTHKLQPTAVRFGMFELDLQTSELRKNGRTIPLQGQPVKLLILLATHPGELVTREDIEKALWPDRIVEFEHLINDAVRRIRKALLDDADNPKFIQTLHGRGYRFIALVQPADPSPDACAADYGLVNRRFLSKGGPQA